MTSSQSRRWHAALLGAAAIGCTGGASIGSQSVDAGTMMGTMDVANITDITDITDAMAASDTVDCGARDAGTTTFAQCFQVGGPVPAGSTNVTIGPAPAALLFQPGADPGGLTSTCTTSGTSPGYARTVSPLSWTDACATAGHLTFLSGGDDGTASDTLPFNFHFYGAAETSLGLSSNGVLGFQTVSPAWVSTALPNAGFSNAVFAFWDDLVLRANGICSAITGTPGTRQYIAEWGPTPTSTVRARRRDLI